LDGTYRKGKGVGRDGKQKDRWVTFPLLVIISPQNSGRCNSFYCLGHSKNVYDDEMENGRRLKERGVLAIDISW